MANKLLSNIMALFKKKDITQTTDSKMGDKIQDAIARTITRYVIICVAVLGIFGLVMALVALYLTYQYPDKTGVSASIDGGLKILQFIFASILPLLGTWIGTVLAFYFSKENFAAANANAQSLVDKITSSKKLASIKAKDKMVPLASIDKYKVAYENQSSEAKIVLTEAISFLNDNKRNRLVLLSAANQAKMVIHKSILTEFISISASVNKADLNKLTLENMRADGTETMKRIMDNSIVFVDENATLETAKKKMNEKNGSGKDEVCQDVFITLTGDEKEVVIGWITEAEIANNSVVD